MTINRHNYEEYFILYMDNELDNEARRMVETFVQQHPDLKEELDTLLQYKLVPDTSVIFPAKEELMKENGHTLITETNYEEWLTLYTDNELSAEQRILVERFVAFSPAARQELTLLQKIKMQPEEVVFPDKASLYRTEEKRRIIPWNWRAVAAVLLVLLAVTAVLVFNNKGADPKDNVADNGVPAEQKQPVKENSPVLVQEENNTPVIAKDDQTPEITPVITPNNEQPTPVLPGKNNAVANKNKIVSPLPVNDPSPVIKKEDPVIVDNNNKPSNNLPQPLNNPNIPDNKTGDIAMNNTPKENDNSKASGDENVTKDKAATSDVIYASNTETLEQPDGKKNKNRGIFRKIARTFEKRTNIDPTDDNKLLVAGLAIKLK